MARTQRKKIRILDEGVEVTQDVDSLNFLGSSLNVTASQNNVTVDDTTAVVGPASATDGGVALFDGTTGKLLKNSTNFVQTATGTVGIGTLTPHDFLEVKSNSALIPTVAFYNSTGTNTFKVLENGNVGIGTTTPGAKLTVQNATPNVTTQISDSGVGFTRASDGLTTAGLSYSGDTALDLSSNGGGSYLTFTASNAERMRIDSNGNVGIGTTIPTIKLQVESNKVGSDGLFIRNSNAGTTSLSIVSTNSDAGQMSLNAYSSAHSVWANKGSITSSAGLTGGMFLYANAGNMDFWTGGSDRMTILNNGNVGIGTTSPSSKLEVAGKVTVTGANIRLSNNYFLTSNTVAGVEVPLISRNTSDRVSIDGDGYGTIFGGNIGIGTTSPSSKLDVAGTIRTTANTPVAAGQGLEFSYVTNYGQINSYNRDASAYTPFRLDGSVITLNSGSNGNVGIGTTNPTYKLDVYGTSRFADIMRFGSTQGFITWGGGMANAFDIAGDSGKALSFGSNGIYDRMVMDTSGNVGIGTTSPTAVLHLKAGGTAAGTAPLKLTTQSAGLTSVEQGTFELIGNSLQFTQLAKRRGVMMSQNVIVADTTVGNTTTESAALITAEHGANSLEVGKMEEIRIIGTIHQKNAGGGTLSIRTKYAGTTILTTTTNTGNIASGTPFEIVVYTTCRSIGATGTMQINATFRIDGVTNVPDAKALVTIDTTTAQNTTVTAQWSVADTSNTITVNQGYVHCIETNK